MNGRPIHAHTHHPILRVKPTDDASLPAPKNVDVRLMSGGSGFHVRCRALFCSGIKTGDSSDCHQYKADDVYRPEEQGNLVAGGLFDELVASSRKPVNEILYDEEDGTGRIQIPTEGRRGPEWPSETNRRIAVGSSLLTVLLLLLNVWLGRVGFLQIIFVVLLIDPISIFVRTVRDVASSTASSKRAEPGESPTTPRA